MVQLVRHCLFRKSLWLLYFYIAEHDSDSIEMVTRGLSSNDEHGQLKSESAGMDAVHVV